MPIFKFKEEKTMAEETKTTETTPEETAPEQTAKTYSEEEYNALADQLKTANETIQSYKDMDIDGIKKSVEDYKAKFEQSEKARRDFEHRTKVNAYVKNLGLKDDVYEKYVSDIIIEKELKFDGDKLIGGDDVVSVFKGKYPDAFKDSKPLPEFSVSTTGTDNTKDNDAFIRAVMGIK